MRPVRKLFLSVIFMAILLVLSFVGSSDAAVKSKVKSGRPPLGWQYEPGYTLWRLERNLGVNVQIWKKYVREKKWKQNRGDENLAEKLILNPIDWVYGETTYFLDSNSNLFRFQPAGTESSISY